jgi:hypothetical protein
MCCACHGNTVVPMGPLAAGRDRFAMPQQIRQGR